VNNELAQSEEIYRSFLGGAGEYHEEGFRIICVQVHTRNGDLGIA
jgi:hypothetical protein